MLLGSLLPLGGTVGFLRKGSVPSLVAGLFTGSLFWLAWHISRNTRQSKTGNTLALLTSLALAVAMFGRFVATKRRVPLVVCITAALSAVVFVSEVNSAS